MEPAFARIGIVGAGQVGTALGYALRRARAAREVVVSDRDPDVARRSVARGGGDRAVPASEALAADAVVLALPLEAIGPVLDEARGAIRAGALVIDTATVKAPVVGLLASLPRGIHAIGGHPIAGTERPGPEGADPDGLRGATFALTPVRDDARAVRLATALVEAVGARPVVLDAAAHDRAIARVIGLPHLVAFALRAVTGADAALGGPSYRGATRVASGDPAPIAEWTAAMAGDLRPAIAELRGALDRLERALDDPAALASEMSR